jgi:hypothetical protein
MRRGEGETEAVFFLELVMVHVGSVQYSKLLLLYRVFHSAAE